MKLFKVTTLSQSVNTYWVKAKSEEHARDEVCARDAGGDHWFEPANQEFTPEHIIMVEQRKQKHFDKWLSDHRELGPESNVSYWMGTKLIREVDYYSEGLKVDFTESDEDHISRNVFRNMCSSMIVGTPAIE